MHKHDIKVQDADAYLMYEVMLFSLLYPVRHLYSY